MDRVTIFGAGHVGATTAFYLAISAGLEIAMVDIEAGKARGLAMDIEQALPFTGSSSHIEGGPDYGLVEGSDLVVVTAGFARMPGMSRTDLTQRNAPIISDICREVAKKAPEAVLLVVTNPLDEMTYVAWQASGFEHSRVMGMAGVLDTSRFVYFLHRLAGLEPRDVNTMVLGSHGDEMAPLVDWSKAADRPLSEVLEADALAGVVQRTRDGGAEIVGHLGAGSAYYAPAVSISTMALAILGDTGRVLPVSAYLSGQYGVEGIFLGVPAALGREGVREILELPLSEQELAGLQDAASRVSRRVSGLGADRR
ncbi:MAG: malate dehydrogenase [Actinobacteria bacterium]|nr:malate dehydrogenase [Actinomycetota bacterium]MBU1942331.1 malate dehydrogenase [Actinomycetota bacterium]MBU2686887.1 malate dehydrogenase [Actinomycetota bacterium]